MSFLLFLTEEHIAKMQAFVDAKLKATGIPVGSLYFLLKRGAKGKLIPDMKGGMP